MTANRGGSLQEHWDQSQPPTWCWDWVLGVPPRKAHRGGVFSLALQEERAHANQGGGGRAARPRRRVFPLRVCSHLGPQVGGFGWIRASRTCYLYFKISLGITSNSYVLAVSEEDSSLLRYCSLSPEDGGTLSWPTAIRIFLRESPWTKKSVFSFLWKLWCSLRKQRDLDPVQEKCNLQTNSLGKSVPHP